MALSEETKQFAGKMLFLVIGVTVGNFLYKGINIGLTKLPKMKTLVAKKPETTVTAEVTE